MEIVAAASSVAGILSLAGQSIDGALKLRDLFSNMSRASSTTGRFLHDINALLQALQSAKDVLENLPVGFCGSQVTSLSIDLQYCNKDLYRILDIARSLRPASDVGAKAWFQRFLVAVNKSLLVDFREELERHKQAINLSLVVLGRAMDIHIAGNVKQLQFEFQQNTAVSLSKIEEQNVILERIEKHSETGVMRSAASDKSLHSIATSLSRIEALALSAAGAAMSQKTDESEISKLRVRAKRRSTGDFTRTRRRSGSSVMSGRVSVASAKSLPAVPTIPEKHLSSTEPPRLSGVSETSWKSSCKETQTPWTSIYSTPKHISVDPPFIASAAPDSPVKPATVDNSLLQQHQLFRHLTQETMAIVYSPAVLEYITLIKAIQDYENKISFLNLLNFGTNLESTPAFQTQSTVSETDIFLLAQQRNVLQDRLWNLLDDLQDCRRRCIFEGHSLHDIDERLGIKRIDNTCNSRGSETLSDEIQRDGSKLLSCWSDNRDRINRWLLDSLRSDEQQAQLHRSMLADPPINDEYWTRQVLRHWYIDEAAVGEELPIPRSVGAVDSHTLDSLNAVVVDSSQGIKVPRSPFADETAVQDPALPSAARAMGCHVGDVPKAAARLQSPEARELMVESGVF